ncbi:MAG: hypothetical protein ACI4PM_02635 [Butyricicoccus sp.]
MKKRLARPENRTGAKEYNETYTEKAARRRSQKRRRQKQARIFQLVLAACIIMGLAAASVMQHITKTQLVNEVNSKQKMVSDLESEYTSLKAQQESSMTLAEIEDYAENVLGLVQLDRSQEEYLSVEKPDSVEVSSGSSGMSKLVSNVVKSFNAILSFLR